MIARTASTLLKRSETHSRADVTSGELRERGPAESSFSSTLHESLQAEAVEDATVVWPPPRRSDLKKRDLTVRGGWEECPWCDDEIEQALELPITHNQRRAMVEHLTTSKPKVQARSDKAKAVKKWFEESIPMQTGHRRSTTRFVRRLTTQMINWGVAPVIRQRSQSREAGGPYRNPMRGRMENPVWSWAVPDVRTMESFIDTKGRPRKWRQKPGLFSDGKPKKYPASDTFVCRLPWQDAGDRFWTPPMVLPALYSSIVLQELQEDLEGHSKDILSLRAYASVGDKEYKDGNVGPGMLDDVAFGIETTGDNEMPVFKWPVSIETIDQDARTEELLGVIRFWEQEIRRAVGGSRLQDGQGDSATRNTSDALMEMEMRSAESLVPEIQLAFQWLCLPKMLEEGATPESIMSGEDEMPVLEFEEIDMRKQIRRENHYTFLFQNEGLTHGEYREAIRKEAETGKSDQYWSDIHPEDSGEEQTNQTRSQERPGGKPRPSS